MKKGKVPKNTKTQSQRTNIQSARPLQVLNKALKMAQEPNDDIVKNAIINAISKLDDKIRPNKLRKIICRKVDGTNWTQYQRVLDKMVKEKDSLQTCTVGDELLIFPLTSTTTTTAKLTAVAESSNGSSSLSPSPEKEMLTTKMKIPLAIVYHLTKKKNKKQKSLELNTKTKFIFKQETLLAIKGKTKFDPNERIKFTIQSMHLQGLNKDEDDYDHDEEVDKAKRHIKTAKIMVNNMVKAFGKDPDHFCPPIEGGTFKEQAEIKKRKLEGKQKWNKKTKFHQEDGVNSNIDDQEAKLKKRNRKYY
jgi:hypothetical protein